MAKTTSVHHLPFSFGLIKPSQRKKEVSFLCLKNHQRNGMAEKTSRFTAAVEILFKISCIFIPPKSLFCAPCRKGDGNDSAFGQTVTNDAQKRLQAPLIVVKSQKQRKHLAEYIMDELLHSLSPLKLYCNTYYRIFIWTIVHMYIIWLFCWDVKNFY